MGKKDAFGNGKSLEDVVKKALRDGDFKDLGSAAQKALDTLIFGSRPHNNVPPGTPPGTTQSGWGSPTQSPPSPQADPVQPPSSSYPPPRTRPVQSSPHASYPPPQARSVQSTSLSPVFRSSGRINRRVPRGLPQIILGSIGTFFFGTATPFFAAFLLNEAASPLFYASVALTAGCAVATFASILLLGEGVSRYKLADRAIKLVSHLQGKKVYTFDELAAKTGRSPKQIKRDLKKLRARNLFPEIYTDAGETCVMWGQDTYEHYLKSEEARTKKLREEEDRRLRLQDPATADIEHFRSEGETIILKIRAANDAIHGEEISAKLETLEDTVKRIFTYVERYPEKLPETRKFMNYYLPTTLKLVEKYHQYDRMDFEPQNVRQTKAEIERSMDTINVAFNNLLESLFTHDTLDVATDIEVLERMLEQEGLTGKTFKIDKPGQSQKLL